MATLGGDELRQNGTGMSDMEILVTGGAAFIGSGRVCL